jgi:hypothetical protein
MTASAADVGAFNTYDILSRKDADGSAEADAMDQMGHLGSRLWVHRNSRALSNRTSSKIRSPKPKAKTVGLVDSGQAVVVRR